MQKELLPYLQTLADVLRENEMAHLIEEVAKKDFHMAQVLEIMIREDLAHLES
ncbi:hypothetical protein [Sporosarcina psychrophila]|uniref:hypothetical protein n=1 Tax=Sporosarcina psychrophila TaxID=1476 RepID=UPI000B31BD86|nr:hypothetical protein [Sporosarcina psychrophila]